MCICITENLDKLRLNECSGDNIYNSFWLAGLTFFLTFFSLFNIFPIFFVSASTLPYLIFRIAKKKSLSKHND